MILDALFIVVFKWGVFGGALATAISQSLGGLIPLIYFIRKNKSLLRIGKTKFDIKVILNTCSNGSSEFISNISTSIVSIVFNLQLMKFYGFCLWYFFVCKFNIFDSGFLLFLIMG